MRHAPPSWCRYRLEFAKIGHWQSIIVSQTGGFCQSGQQYSPQNQQFQVVMHIGTEYAMKTPENCLNTA
jgi:hypothetical protein